MSAIASIELTTTPMASSDYPYEDVSPSDHHDRDRDPRFGKADSEPALASEPAQSTLANGQPSSSVEDEGESAEGADVGEALVPLLMSECPACAATEFVSRKLVYEDLGYDEDGTLTAHHRRVRAELELACAECGRRFRELPVECRTFYSEVHVLHEDQSVAIRRRLRSWLVRVRRRLPLV